MKTECNGTVLIFQVLLNCKVVARRDEVTMSSDSGGLIYFCKIIEILET